MPETWAQAAVVLTLVVPGFVYRASWQAVAGPDPARSDFGTRVLHAMVATALFAGTYAAVFGPAVAGYAREPGQALDDVRGLALTFVALALGVPWASARIAFSVVTSRRYRRLVVRALTALRIRAPHQAAPCPWDHAFGRVREGWVRVQFADGRWLGGGTAHARSPARTRTPASSSSRRRGWWTRTARSRDASTHPAAS